MANIDVKTAVVVFTRDLRVHDNPALVAACAQADAVVPMFVVDESIIGAASPNRIKFLVDSLHDLDRSLRRRGAPLVLRCGRWVEEVMAVASQTSATSIHVADDVSAFARLRLQRLRDAAGSARISLELHPGVTVVAPGDVQPRGAGDHYEVFTPYHRSWTEASWRPAVPAPQRVQLPTTGELPGIELLATVGFDRTCPRVMGGGESAGTRRLEEFIANGLEQYEARHDALAADATSRLSAFLHFGCLSPLETANRARSLPGGDPFVRQLCWRDFFHQVLASRPESAHSDHRDRGERWNIDDDGYGAWCNAKTGFPLIDAAMTQLLEEGFMHNRARMVVASFLTKDLYIDWRLGAAHFMSLLVDADVANNQLNWQWVGGTGTGTNPNRVFNPVVQGRRFDPSGDYIRRYLPTFAELDADETHWPDSDVRRRLGYALPIVDHREAMTAYRSRVRRPST